MRWYKEERFLVMMKDLKYKEALDKVRALLLQAGVSTGVGGGIRFMIRTDWQFMERPEEEALADQLVRAFPWLEEYKVTETENAEDGGCNLLFTNLFEMGGAKRQPADDEIAGLMSKLTSSLCPQEIAVGLEGLHAAGSVKTEETVCFLDGATDYPGNRFCNMAVICRNARTAFFRIVLRLEVDRQGSLQEPFSQLEQLFLEQMGTLTDSRYVEAYTEKELEAVRCREARVNEKLIQLNRDLEKLALPNQYSRNLKATQKGCSVKQAFNRAFKGTGFEFLDAKNFCFKAQLKSRYGYTFRISIDYGGHIWHHHTLILEVSGINFSRQLLQVDGLSPQSQEECRMNLENLRMQTMFLVEQAETIFLEEYGETPGWYECYHKYG